MDQHGLSLTEEDDFGSQPLHWAVLFGHLDTVQWISCRVHYCGNRADWAGAFQRVRPVAAAVERAGAPLPGLLGVADMFVWECRPAPSGPLHRDPCSGG